MRRARWLWPLALVSLLLVGTARAAEHPVLTEPVTGSIAHEPVHSGPAPLDAHQGQHAQTAEAEEHKKGHGEHTGVNPWTLALQLLNFGVMVFILIRFGGRAMSKALQARHQKLKMAIEGAALRRSQAEQRFREQEIRLAHLEKELAALRAEVQQAGERERARLLEGAQEKAKRIQEETRIQLEQQIKDAEQRLRTEVASTAIKVADELLKRSVDADDDRRLAQEFVAGASELKARAMF